MAGDLAVPGSGWHPHRIAPRHHRRRSLSLTLAQGWQPSHGNGGVGTAWPPLAARQGFLATQDCSLISAGEALVARHG